MLASSTTVPSPLPVSVPLTVDRPAAATGVVHPEVAPVDGVIVVVPLQVPIELVRSVPVSTSSV